MLSLTLKPGQMFRIGESYIRVDSIDRGATKVSILAPRELRVSRLGEVQFEELVAYRDSERSSLSFPSVDSEA